MNCTVLPIQVLVSIYVRYRCNIIRRKVGITVLRTKLDDTLVLITSKNRGGLVPGVHTLAESLAGCHPLLLVTCELTQVAEQRAWKACRKAPQFNHDYVGST